MILVTTPTGHIGGQVLKKLLTTEAKIRVIARDPSKISDLGEKVEIIQGSLDDANSVAKAYAGIDDLLFVVPPSMQYSNVNEYYLKFANITCQAIKEQKVKRVVFVSGTGLGFEKKAGPVSASYLVEKMLEETGAAVRVLHCGTFMENLLHSIPSLRFKSQFSTTVPTDTKCPWVATKDIADTAVRLLKNKTWTGIDAVGVLGPEDLSYGDIARIMREVVGKEIVYQQVAEETLKTTLLQFGATEAAAQGLLDIYASMKNGVFNKVPRSPQTSSPTSLQQWCRDVLKPALTDV